MKPLQVVAADPNSGKMALPNTTTLCGMSSDILNLQSQRKANLVLGYWQEIGGAFFAMSFTIVCVNTLGLVSYYAFVKRYYVFDQRENFFCVCVSVCLSVITFVARWLHSSTWCQVRSILSIRIRNCNTCQDDPFPDPDKMNGSTKFYLCVIQLGGNHI